MFTLYYARDTCALASHIALEETGADFALHRIDFSTAEQTAAPYRAINPGARVPALVTPQGILTETPAILVYIAQCFPAAGLAPLGDPFAFARMQAFNSYLCATLHVAHAHRMRGYRWADDPAAITAMQRHAPVAVGACYDLIENHLFEGPWVMGDTYSVADPYLFTIAQWIESDGVDPARIPRIVAHRCRMMDRPTVARAIAAEFDS